MFEVGKPPRWLIVTWTVTILILVSAFFADRWSRDDPDTGGQIVVSGKSVPRSSKWPKERAEYLLIRPQCEACGAEHDTQVHHVIPFHVRPDLELDRRNFIGLCGPHGCNAHFRLGHLGNWNKENPRVREEAAKERRGKESR